MVKLATKVAFVTGCNGISGNAIVEHLIRTPKSEWSKIVITSRRPLAIAWQDPRIEFIALDFLSPVSDLIQQMEIVCADVTHAFFTSYVHVDDFKELKAANVPLFQNFLDSIDAVAPRLQNVCLQTGGKHYGVHLGPVHIPVNESMPRYEDHGENFYYIQEDYMFALQKKRSWSHNIIRPHGIIGFTPHSNGMSEAITLALYFLICREMGVPPTFPGNEVFYNTVDDQSYAPSIADMSVWASTTDRCRNEDFVHVNGDIIMWRYHWEAIGKYFGLECPEPTFSATGSSRSKMENNFSMIDWARDKRPYWEAVCEKYGGNPDAFDWGTWGFFDWSIGKTWPTLGTNNKARRYGWTRVDDTLESWFETYKSFEAFGILPKQGGKAQRKGPVKTNGISARKQVGTSRR
ncbi:NAD dependent epimerase dehydratase family protein [Stagonosporopsis vannaccii]|nr:NAD dependent epimerase dehydratase family protein [Stagonosporopsis vannaccii]